MSFSSPTVTLSSLLFLNLAWHLKSRICSENSEWLSRNTVLPGSFQSVVAAVALSRSVLKESCQSRAPLNCVVLNVFLSACGKGGSGCFKLFF